jgi:hypothetical protein
MCADAMVKGDEPPKTQPLNYRVFHQIRNMIACDPAIGMSAWLELRRAAGLPVPALTDPTIARALERVSPIGLERIAASAP